MSKAGDKYQPGIRREAGPHSGNRTAYPLWDDPGLVLPEAPYTTQGLEVGAARPSTSHTAECNENLQARWKGDDAWLVLVFRQKGGARLFPILVRHSTTGEHVTFH